MRTRRALVCTHRMPEFDREGGSRRIYHLLEFLRQDGWSVTFAAENALGCERYARELGRMGVATFALDRSWTGGEQALIDFRKLVGPGRFDLVLFAFWTCAEVYLPIMRALSPESRVVVDSIDLHFLRQSRRAFCDPAGNGHRGALDPDYAHEMIRELNTYAAADAVLTVSEKEAEIVNDFLGRNLASCVPDTEDAQVSRVPGGERRGLLFVGNFRHPPNVQAVEYLCREIRPRLSPEILADHPLYIVGNDPNEAVLAAAAAAENVRLVGWTPSVLPYLERVRLSVVPLLYGAGTKRKLMQSLMVGTPAVSTSIGIEGLNLEHDRHVLVADEPDAFAAAIVRLIRDQALWERLARDGRELITRTHDRPAVAARFATVLAEIMAGATRPV